MDAVAQSVVGFETPDAGTAAPAGDGAGDAAAGDSPVVLAAVVIGVLAAMGLLFTFALLIDCRNQEAEAAKRSSKAEQVARARRKKFTLPQFFRGRNSNGDSLAFASQVCEANRDTNPVVVNINEPIPSTSSVQC